jgi:[ribosomal protein S18]-alanine N-acetyltransferase
MMPDCPLPRERRQATLEEMSASTLLRLGPAAHRDAPVLADLSRFTIERGLPWRWTEPRVAALIRDADSEVVVARHGGALVGFAAMDFHFKERRAHLVLLAVVTAWRRQGVGGELLGWLEKMAVLGGIQAVQAEVRAENVGARRFYASLGFEETGRLPGYYSGREDALALRRRVGLGG